MTKTEWAFLVVGLVAAGVVWRMGYLRRSALDGAPRRDTELGFLDLMVGLMLMYMGMIAARLVMGRLGLWVEESPAMTQADPVTSSPVALPQHQPVAFMQQALLGQALVQLPVMLYVLWRCRLSPGGVAELGLWPRRPVHEAIAGLTALVISVPVVLGLGILVTLAGQWLLDEPRPEYGHELLVVLRESPSVWVTVGLLASAVLVAPLLEEVIFRALVQTSLLGVWGPARRWLIVVTAAVVFTAMHTGQPWQVLPSLFVLGMILGWLYERSGSLLGPVITHAGFNAVNVVLAVG